ncbi:AraC family transcriptional regulator [Chitinophaga lutea]|nr:AraC family transcriptional regulator [Chitinophaga lutea]
MKKYVTFKSHLHFEIALLENCRGKRLIGDHIDGFDAPELVLMGSYLPHCWQYQQVKDPSCLPQCYVIHFLPGFLGKEMLETPEARKLSELFSLAARGILFPGDTVDRARPLIQQLLLEEGFGRISLFIQLMDVLVNSKTYTVLASPYYNAAEWSPDSQKISKVFDFIYRNFRNEISLQEVSAVIHMSTTGFCRFFKQNTKKTFTDVLKEVRIGHAAKLLLDGTHNVSGACYESGYNNLSNFNKHFKEVKGRSPRDFLKQYEINPDRAPGGTSQQ